jgi:hypothetical protein
MDRNIFQNFTFNYEYPRGLYIGKQLGRESAPSFRRKIWEREEKKRENGREQGRRGKEKGIKRKEEESGKEKEKLGSKRVINANREELREELYGSQKTCGKRGEYHFRVGGEYSVFRSKYITLKHLSGNIEDTIPLLTVLKSVKRL